MIKRTAIREYANVRKNGLNAISLREGDELLDVKATDGKKDLILVTRKGMCIRFHESDGRAVGRASIGVRAVRLSEGDEVVGIIVSDEAPYVLIVTENGMGKRTRVEEFRAQSRGGVGVKCYKITPKTGELMGAMAVDTDDEIIIISTEGVIIRMSCENISVVGRITSGVRLMDLGEGDKAASVEKVRGTVSRDKDVPEDPGEEDDEEDPEESEEDWSGEETDPESGDE